ncbi:flagellar motor protein MotA [Helicobacter valdiviensis]|uniref:Flagellar motor protein MotA n=1 Tax=Helicobacter valdiviensis TaxID=1458358 RepID=A0A2W6MT19_9HELI|nr:MotA/TolQ/ExbB proton channel family protein [Helicobacter valdiviensis]PZT47694.1 flagellar motor protein MotA [Helicobacter valdiviensis]
MSLTFFNDIGFVTLGVLAWLSLYFICVVWVFLYRYFRLSSIISNEKEAVESLLMGKNSLMASSALSINLRKVDKKITQSMLQYSMDQAIKDATVGLSFLAIVASTAPFIGLFGTVIEILEAFSKLGMNSKATLDVIAPVISKALVATAVGILTAIPAYSFNLILKRKVFELNTYLQAQINILLSPNNSKTTTME